jgi:Transposase/zinc-finger of transposase IS204/IS1001/IS1096/IS1165/Helix-turn-helix domain of transposase family ISL3
MAETLEQHYRRLLGLEEPWVVEEVDLDLAGQRVEIRLRTRSGLKMPCPECAVPYALYDHGPERRWRHLDTMQFETMLKARVPRINCQEHGVKTVEVPWAGKNSRFTLMFEAFAIRVLEASATVKAAALLLRLDWHSLHQIMERAVKRGLDRRAMETVRRIGIDEKSFGHGQSYVTLMSDLEVGRVLEVVPERTKEACQELWQRLGQQQCQSVEAVAIDMWEPFLSATEAAASQAQIVHDKFHVSKHLNEAVDQVRQERESPTLFRRPGQPHWNKVPLAQKPGELEPEPKRALRRPTQHWIQGGQSLANQGTVPRFLALLGPGGSFGVLQALVQLGESLSARSDQRGCPDAQDSPQQSTNLLRTSDHKRHERGLQFQDPEP